MISDKYKRNFYHHLFDEFRAVTYLEGIEYIKSREYDKVAHLTNFSYDQLTKLLKKIISSDYNVINDIFDYCIECAKSEEYQYHGLLISLDSGDEISTYLKNKDYRKLLEKIIKDLDIS